MTPQSALFLEKAQRLIAEAEIMLGVGLNEAAGRSAYLAGFHAAQALIFERGGKVLKTHRGVQAEFLRLTKDDARIDPALRSFLSRSYNIKAVADYEIGPASDLAPERAEAAVAESGRFLAWITDLADRSPAGVIRRTMAPLRRHAAMNLSRSAVSFSKAST